MNEFSVDAPIIRKGEVTETKIHLQRIIHTAGAQALTHFKKLDHFKNVTGAFSLLEARPITGRTHQIRVHMSGLRHSCCGDLTYGADPTLAAKLKLDRQWLHAVRLGFAHPISGDQVSFTSPYAPDLARSLELARNL
jgi:23S rRNA pseudouridine1911/1915/1917 synthase